MQQSTRPSNRRTRKAIPSFEWGEHLGLQRLDLGAQLGIGLSEYALALLGIARRAI
jgi:hypothetical protein